MEAIKANQIPSETLVGAAEIKTQSKANCHSHGLIAQAQAT